MKMAEIFQSTYRSWQFTTTEKVEQVLIPAQLGTSWRSFKYRKGCLKFITFLKDPIHKINFCKKGREADLPDGLEFNFQIEKREQCYYRPRWVHRQYAIHRLPKEFSTDWIFPLWVTATIWHVFNLYKYRTFAISRELEELKRGDRQTNQLHGSVHIHVK